MKNELLKAFIFKTDWMKTVVGISMIAIFCFLVYAIVYVPLQPSVNDIIIHVLGIMEGAVIGIVSYYYGSSKGSQEKQEIIRKHVNNLTPDKE